MNSRKIYKKLIKNKSSSSNYQILVRLDLPPFGNKINNFKKMGQHRLIDSLLNSASHSSGFNAVVDSSLNHVYFDFVLKDYYRGKAKKLSSSLARDISLANKLNIPCKITTRLQDV